MNNNKHIAFITCERIPTVTPDDALALPHLTARKIVVEPVIWDDPKVDWKKYDHVILRSTWDYYHKYPKFLDLIETFEQNSLSLFNIPSVVKWNINKRYLKLLEDAGFTIPPTIWIENNTAFDLGELLKAHDWEKVVIKPIISAAANQTWTATSSDYTVTQSKLNEMLQTKDMMVQQFMSAIETIGEWSNIFFSGKYSHTVLKKPASGDFRVQEVHGGSVEAALPSPKLLERAKDIMSFVSSHLQETPLYARVDLIEQNGEPILMELELIEPSLYMSYHEHAPKKFAEAIHERLA